MTDKSRLSWKLERLTEAAEVQAREARRQTALIEEHQQDALSEQRRATRHARRAVEHQGRVEAWDTRRKDAASERVRSYGLELRRVIRQASAEPEATLFQLLSLEARAGDLEPGHFHPAEREAAGRLAGDLEEALDDQRRAVGSASDLSTWFELALERARRVVEVLRIRTSDTAADAALDVSAAARLELSESFAAEADALAKRAQALGAFVDDDIHRLAEPMSRATNRRVSPLLLVELRQRLLAGDLPDATVDAQREIYVRSKAAVQRALAASGDDVPEKPSFGWGLWLVAVVAAVGLVIALETGEVLVGETTLHGVIEVCLAVAIAAWLIGGLARTRRLQGVAFHQAEERARVLDAGGDALEPMLLGSAYVVTARSVARDRATMCRGVVGALTEVEAFDDDAKRGGQMRKLEAAHATVAAALRAAVVAVLQDRHEEEERPDAPDLAVEDQIMAFGE